MKDITIHQILQPEIPNRFCKPFSDVFFWLSKIFAAKCNFTGCIHIEKLGPGVLKHTAYNCGCIVKRLLGNLFPIYKSGKVPFAFDYADADADVIPSADAVEKYGNDHGTHVAGITAGKTVDADGMVWFCHWGCKMTLGGARLGKKAFEEAGLPTLLLDGDSCDRGFGGEGQAATRVEAFLEVLEGLA